MNGPVTLPRGIRYQRITNASGKTIDGKWFYDDDAAKIREAYRILLADHTITIAALAKRVGWKWDRSLKRSMQNAVWKGWRVYPAAGGGEELKIKLPLEPLVTEAEWAKAGTLIDGKRNWSRKPPTRGSWRRAYW